MNDGIVGVKGVFFSMVDWVDNDLDVAEKRIEFTGVVEGIELEVTGGDSRVDNSNIDVVECEPSGVKASCDVDAGYVDVTDAKSDVAE